MSEIKYITVETPPVITFYYEDDFGDTPSYKVECYEPVHDLGCEGL